MAKSRWHIVRDTHGLTLARRLPVRFDICVDIIFPRAQKLYLAQQIRQDLWRRLQKLRGFAPVVRIIDHNQGLLVRAGGQVAAAVSRPRAEQEIKDVLTDVTLQSRWLSQARRGPCQID